MISPDQERTDALAYIDELESSRLGKMTERAKSIPAGQLGSVEWFEEVGNYWKEVRETSGTERYDVAARIGLHVNVVRFLEHGLAYPEELQGDLLPKLSQSLTGDLRAFETFSQRYNVAEIPVKTPRFKLLPFIAHKWEPVHKVS